MREQCPTCKEWCAHGFCGRCERVLPVHGIDCEKKPHVRTGYLHGEDDDTPYDVDHMKYCGRCHRAL